MQNEWNSVKNLFREEKNSIFPNWIERMSIFNELKKKLSVDGRNFRNIYARRESVKEAVIK